MLRYFKSEIRFCALHKVPKVERGENNTENIIGGNIFVRVHDLDFLISGNLYCNNLNLEMLT